MNAEDVKRFKRIYAEHRKLIIEPMCTYEQLVVSDTVMNNIVSWTLKDIDIIRANVPLKDDAGEYSEAKIERLFKNASIEEKHLLRICEGLLATIKSKMYRDSK